MISLITLYASTNARATSADDASFHTDITDHQIVSKEASMLLHSCNWALCLCDIIGNRLRSNTLQYGPNDIDIEIVRL
jgi:hypothetical protein